MIDSTVSQPPIRVGVRDELATLTRLVATHGLPQAIPIDEVVVDSLDDRTFRSLVRDADRQRVTGQLMDAVSTGRLPATDEQAAEVAARHLDWCTSMLGLERELLRVVAVLQAADIEVIVLKGTAAAHLHYPDPSLRLFGDNDILLRSEQFDLALKLLCEEGYARRKAPARPDFDRRFGKGATLHHMSGRELDVHRTLVFGTFGFTIDLEELWDTSTTFIVGDRELRALGPDTALLHGMFHAALGDAAPQLGVLRDLAQQLAADRYDAEQIVEIAQLWRAMPVVKRAIGLLDEHLGVVVSGPIGRAASVYRPSPRESRAVASYIADHRSFAAMVLSSLPYLPSMRDRLAFLRAVTTPSREFAASRGSASPLAWWRRGFRAVCRSVGR